MKSFTDTYNWYNTHAILSLNFLNLNGSANDGVVEPGESFSVKFRVTNIGGIASPLTYTVQGDVSEPKIFNDKVDGLSTKIINSQLIREIDNRLDDGANAKVTLKVNDQQEQIWQKIQRPIEFQNITSSNNMLAGSGIFTVILDKISKVALNGKITLELKIGGKLVKAVPCNSMNPGESKSYALDFNGLDPLQWITGNYPVELLVYRPREFLLPWSYFLKSIILCF